MAMPRQLLLACLFLALALPLSAQADTPPPPKPPAPVPPDLVVLHDVVYGKGGTQDLHAEICYSKKVTGPMPAILCVHGGGWIEGSNKSVDLTHFARAGYFAASIEYRLSNTAKWPAQIQDCKCAVRWLRANAAQYNVDPDRIGLWGGSAGGHLVACLGTITNVPEFDGDGGYPGVSSSVKCVVDLFGPVDLTNPKVNLPGALNVVQRLFPTPYEKDPDLWKKASPINYVAAGDPPFLILHGDADTVVPLAQSTAFAAALTKAGVPNQLIVVHNAIHGLAAVRGTKTSPDANAVNRAMYDFLAKYLTPTAPAK
jgi:acetyl esterase/lipase